MKKDTEITEVIFRKEKDGDIMAILPYEPFNHVRNVVACYVHTGQHGGCHFDYALKETKPAKPNEYADLLAEMNGLGYNIKAIKRINYRKYEREYSSMMAEHYSMK